MVIGIYVCMYSDHALYVMKMDLCEVWRIKKTDGVAQGVVQ
jgi:hypothetical protein